MVFSEDKDTKALKSGVIGVVVLLVLGSISPMIIGEFTGIDLDTLCAKGEVPPAGEESCINTEDPDLGDNLLNALGYIPVVVAVVALVGFTIVGVKY